LSRKILFSFSTLNFIICKVKELKKRKKISNLLQKFIYEFQLKSNEEI